MLNSDNPNSLIPGLRTVTATPNAAGRTAYLPYEDNRIRSVRLPTFALVNRDRESSVAVCRAGERNPLFCGALATTGEIAR